MQRVVFAISLLIGSLGTCLAGPAMAACTVATMQPHANCMRSVLVGKDLRGRDLTGIYLMESAMTGVDLTGAKLTGASFLAADLRYSYLNGADLSKATLPILLTGAEMAQATLTDSITWSSDFSDVYAPMSVWLRADLQGSSFDRADLTGANFTDANLAATTARNTRFTGANMVRANLLGANLSGAVLRGANLTGARLGTASTNFTNLQNADLTGAAWIDGTVCGSGSIGRCLPTAITGAPDMLAAPIRPRSGLWYAAGGGTGYLLETTGSGLRLIVLGFDGQGSPTWSTAEGALGRDNVFTADLRRCTGAATGPADCGTDLGPITVAFDSATSASLLAPNTVALRIALAPRN